MAVIFYYAAPFEVPEQALVIQTDITMTTPIVCLITVMLTPVVPYLTLSSDKTKIVLDGSKLTDPDIGSHEFTLAATIVTLLGSSSQYFKFFVDVQACKVNIFYFSEIVANFTIALPSGALDKKFKVLQQDLTCKFPVTFTSSYAKDGSNISKPAWIDLVSVVNGVES